MEAKIIDYIKSELAGDPNAALTADDDLLNSGLVDSMGVMRLIAFIEEEFNVKIPPQDLVIENFVSVSAMVAYLNKVSA